MVVVTACAALACAANASALAWQSVHVVASAVSAVTCDPGGDLCAGADVSGSVAVSSDPLGGVSRWHAFRVDPPSKEHPNTSLFGISCPSASLCVAVDFSGGLMTSTNPTGGDGAWTRAQVHDSFYDVSCASTTLCVALGADNQALVSTEPANAASWKASGGALAVAPTVLRSVTCVAASTECVVVGEVIGEGVGVIVTSSDPVGGSWSAATHVGTHALSDVACPSSALCVASELGGGVLASGTPTSASSFSPTLAPTGAWYGTACASASLCFAHDTEGNVITSADPLGGAWLNAKVDTVVTEQLPSRMACAAQGSVCLFGDQGGNVVVSGAGQALAGTVTDPGGGPLVGVPVEITGTDEAGPVSVHALTGADGSYSASLQPGAYTVTVAQPPTPAKEGSYVSSACPGAIQLGSCPLTLNASESATVDFKLVKLVVNSAVDDADPQSSVERGLCDTTPSASSQLCTLRAAIEVANHLGGGIITFDIPVPGVPLIATPQTGEPALEAPTVIDGTTQPGAGLVEVSFRGECTKLDPSLIGIRLVGGGSTVRGLVIDGYDAEIRLDGAGHDTVQGNRLGTDASGSSVSAASQSCGSEPGTGGIVVSGGGANQIGGPAPGQGNLISGTHGSGVALSDSFGNVVQGNTIGPALGSLSGKLGVRQLASITATGGGGNTIGGGAHADGNVALGPAFFVEDNDVVQANRFLNAQVTVSGHGNTIGGPTPAAGSGAGNEFFDDAAALLLVKGEGSVVQGNLFREYLQTGVVLQSASHTTIGGARADLGNVFETKTTGKGIVGDEATITIGSTGNGPFGKSSDNSVANNQIRDNVGDGAVGVYGGSGNTITENRMTGTVGIGVDLGGGPFRYNELNSPAGPNDLQRYPNLLGSAGASTVKADVRIDDGLHGAHRRYTIDIYAQESCAKEAITPGEGAVYLGRATVTADGLGSADAAISFPRAAAGTNKALTATATAEDGSTSEFSPCLKIGKQALAFLKGGVQVRDPRIDLSPPPVKKNARQSRANSKPTRKKTSAHPPLSGVVHVLCPARTERSCAGTIKLTARVHGHARTLATASFKLAPGQLGAIAIHLSVASHKQLGRTRRLRARLLASAHDAARHPHVRRSARTVLLSIG